MKSALQEETTNCEWKGLSAWNAAFCVRVCVCLRVPIPFAGLKLQAAGRFFCTQIPRCLKLCPFEEKRRVEFSVFWV